MRRYDANFRTATLRVDDGLHIVRVAFEKSGLPLAVSSADKALDTLEQQRVENLGLWSRQHTRRLDVGLLPVGY